MAMYQSVCVTLQDVLYTICNNCGPVQRIVIFRKNGVQAMVEYPFRSCSFLLLPLRNISMFLHEHLNLYAVRPPLNSLLPHLIRSKVPRGLKPLLTGQTSTLAVAP